MERFRDHIRGTLGASDFLATLVFYFFAFIANETGQEHNSKGLLLNLSVFAPQVQPHPPHVCKFILARTRTTTTDQPMFSIQFWTHMKLFGFKHCYPFPFCTLQFYLEYK